jgi:inner membrane protein
MKKISHTIVGLSGLWFVLSPHWHFLLNQKLGNLVLACAVGSIAPDFDLFWSNRNLKFKERTLLNSHRGITHHAFLGIFFFLSAFLVSSLVFKAFAIGYFLHLFADMFSGLGIPYGSYRKRLGFNFYRTGTISEFLVLLMFVSVFLLLS